MEIQMNTLMNKEANKEMNKQDIINKEGNKMRVEAEMKVEMGKDTFMRLKDIMKGLPEEEVLALQEQERVAQREKEEWEEWMYSIEAMEEKEGLMKPTNRFEMAEGVLHEVDAKSFYGAYGSLNFHPGYVNGEDSVDERYAKGCLGYYNALPSQWGRTSKEMIANLRTTQHTPSTYGLDLRAENLWVEEHQIMAIDSVAWKYIFRVATDDDISYIDEDLILGLLDIPEEVLEEERVLKMNYYNINYKDFQDNGSYFQLARKLYKVTEESQEQHKRIIEITGAPQRPLLTTKEINEGLYLFGNNLITKDQNKNINSNLHYELSKEDKRMYKAELECNDNFWNEVELLSYLMLVLWWERISSAKYTADFFMDGMATPKVKLAFMLLHKRLRLQQ